MNTDCCLETAFELLNKPLAQQKCLTRHSKEDAGEDDINDGSLSLNVLVSCLLAAHETSTCLKEKDDRSALPCSLIFYFIL